MSSTTVIYALAFYTAFAIMVIGLIRKIVQFASTPSPLKIPVTPAPLTRSGVVLRIFKEVVFFDSLFRSNKWIWLFGALFHAGMLLVLLRHMRYFQEPVWWWVVLVQPFGSYAGLAMLAGLAGLWGRRMAVDRIRYISRISDHVMLLILLGLGITGYLVRFVTRTDIIAVKAFFLGLMRFEWHELPREPVLLTHLSLVILLMTLLPFSKLLHIPGLFFAPSRTQVDDAREKRLLAEWAAPMDAQRDA